MAKPYEPIQLNAKQALKAIAKGDRLQSVCYGVEAQFAPSDDQELNKTYIEQIYEAGGYIKSIGHLDEAEQSLYLDANTLHGNAQFIELLNRWNENDLATAKANKQRITKELRQSISTANQNRLTEVFRLLAPATIRQAKQRSAGATGGQKSQKTKTKDQTELNQRIKDKAKSLLGSHAPRNIASIIASQFGLTPTQIRNHLKK